MVLLLEIITQTQKYSSIVNNFERHPVVWIFGGLIAGFIASLLAKVTTKMLSEISGWKPAL